MGVVQHVRIRLIAFGLIVAFVLLSQGCVYFANRFAPHPDTMAVEVTPSQSIASSGVEIKIINWNLGYAGMGKDSDFILDHGSQYRPLSKDLVAKNLLAINDHLANAKADVLMLQEVAKRSWNTYQTDVYKALQVRFPAYGWTYSFDVRTRWVPWPFTIRNGNATASLIPIASAETRALTLEPNFFLGMFRKQYRMHIARLDHQGRPWVLVNIHLSAFDKEEDAVREKQLQEVLGFAQQEYLKGNHVVIGGDWNLRLAPTEFPHTTAIEDLFWVRDLPQELIPEGWTWGVDPQVPTVRSANKPFVEGENYLLIIDGFLVSPNVEVLSVQTDNLQFEHTDHHPVSITVRAR